jgi:hypothetical protein
MAILFSPHFWCEMFLALLEELFEPDYEARQ